MSNRIPPPTDLALSQKWITYKFGIKGHYRSALRQTDRCLDTIAGHEYDLLTTKVSLLACLERWDELCAFLAYLLNRFPRDAEIFNDVADIFSAHGDWETSLSILERAERYLDPKKQRYLIDNYYTTWLECIYAIKGQREALRFGKRVLKKRRALSSFRIILKHVENDVLKVEAYAPKGAPYLVKLRRLST